MRENWPYPLETGETFRLEASQTGVCESVKRKASEGGKERLQA
jgi:hypothetical protein